MRRGRILLNLKCGCNKRCSPNAVWEKIKILGGVDQYENSRSYKTKEYWSGPKCKTPEAPKYFNQSLGRQVSFQWSEIDQSLVDYISDLKNPSYNDHT